MTWSNYKRLNIVKFLIGITSQEVISVISKARGGGGGGERYVKKMSLKTLLKKIATRENFFLAERSFDIADNVGFS